MPEPIFESFLQPSRFEAIHLEPSLWDQMLTDLHVLMKHHVDDPERDLWLEEQASTSRKDTGFFYGLTRHEKIFSRYETITTSRDETIKTLLMSIKSSDTFFPSKSYDLKIVTDDKHPRCTWETSKSSNIIYFQIFIDQSDHPHAQEELLHAAQEILFGNDRFKRFSTRKTTEQLVHTSFLLDMAMSLAAKEEGTWDKWHKKANELQLEQRNKFIKSYSWQDILLGKKLNSRFQYKNITLEEIGIFWKNLGKYFDDMFDDVGNVINQEMAEIFELSCLAYGLNHRDLSYTLVDLPIDPNASNEQAGRTVVDWAKRLLVQYEGTPIEEELLSHHKQVTSIPKNYFNYQLPEAFMRFYYNSFVANLPRSINVSTINNISNRNWLTKVNEIMLAWTKYSQNHLSKEKFEIFLKKQNFPINLFYEIVDRADELYKIKPRSADITPVDSMGRSIFSPRREKFLK